MRDALGDRTGKMMAVLLVTGALVVGWAIIAASRQTYQGPVVTQGPIFTPTIPGIGQTVSGTDWSVLITSVAEMPSLAEGSRQVLPQGKYVLVYLTVTNLGKRQNALGFSSFTLYDSAQREYSVANAAPSVSGFNPTYRASENAALRRFTTDLLPSLSLDTALAFDVVPTASGFQLGGPTLGKARIVLGR